MKYGIRAVAGGGRASARETIGRVAAGAVAKKLLQHCFGTEVRTAVCEKQKLQPFALQLPMAALSAWHALSSSASLSPMSHLLICKANASHMSSSLSNVTGQGASAVQEAQASCLLDCCSMRLAARLSALKANCRALDARCWASLLQVLGYVSRVRDVDSHVNSSTFTSEEVEANPVRCPDPTAAEAMYKGGSPALQRLLLLGGQPPLAAPRSCRPISKHSGSGCTLRLPMCIFELCLDNLFIKLQSAAAGRSAFQSRQQSSCC